MSEFKRWQHVLTIALVLALALSSQVFAQGQSGKGALYGTVKSDTGDILPGVTVTLSGHGADQVAISDGAGNFRFLGLDAAEYSLDARLDGFSTVEFPKLEIRVNQNVTIEVVMSSAIQEVITVTSETPLLDERKITQRTTVTRLELDKIPTSRDPWAVAQQAPGVVMDRVNVGGNESGQQPNFIGTGSYRHQNKFMLDGVDITDQSAVGASATYFGFEQFEQQEISTGGTDVYVMTPGVQINLVTKRGTSEWRGSTSYFLTDDKWQDTPNLDEGDFPADQIDEGAIDPAEFTGNQIATIRQMGIEAGGPVWPEKVFIWGAYDFNNIDQTAFGGDPDDTELENTVVKLNASPLKSNTLEVSWNEGEKVKTGRGAGPSRSSETTWNQGGPSPAWKVEDTHVFGSKLFLTAHWSRMGGGFFLEPQAGREPNLYWDDDGVANGSYIWLDTSRPTYRWEASGAAFFNTGDTAHELKFGGALRNAKSISAQGWPGSGELRGASFYAGNIFGQPVDLVRIRAYRDAVTNTETEYLSYWVQDTLTTARLTVNAGLRYDEQEGRNLASGAPGTAGFWTDPSMVPGALEFPGNDGGAFTWQEVSPRLGVTYALGKERLTLLRASFSRFSEQLGTGLISRVNPVGFARADFNFTDLNGNFLLDDNERASLVFLRTVNFDPENPFDSPNVNDPNLDAMVHDEINLGVERALTPTFVGAATLIYRQTRDYFERRDLVRDAGGNVFVAEYPRDWMLTGTVDGTLPNGDPYSQPLYDLVDGLSFTGGQLLANGDRESNYLGLSLSWTKRLANQWMLRGNVNVNDWEWDIPASFYRFNDPTDARDDSGDQLWNADNDGATVAQQSGGSGNVDVFLSSGWSFNVNGLYQVAPERKWGFNVAANIGGREGFPLVFFESGARPALPNVSVQATPTVDTFRMDDLYTVDLHVDKDVTWRDLSFTLSADLFNAFNAGTVLQREDDLGTGRAGFVDQTLGPRIFRFGVKVAFR